MPLRIGSKITIKNYNTFLENHGSAGYKFWFDKKTSDVFIIGMASTEHEIVISLLQDYFKVPNNGVIFDPPIIVCGQPCKRIYSSLLLVIEFSILSFFNIVHDEPGGTGLKIAPDVAVYPNIAFVPRPSASPVIPVPPSDWSVC